MAVNWTEQAEEMIKSWTGVQRKMWEHWLGAMRSATTQSHTTDTWKQTVDVWSDSVRQALEAQIAWAQFWSESVRSMSGSNRQVVELSDQVLDVMKRWTEAQIRVAESWFETIKHANPASLAMSWSSEDAQRVVRDWQEASQRVLEAQMGWFRLWVAMRAEQWSYAVEEVSSETRVLPPSQVDAGTPARVEQTPPPLETAPATPPVESVPPTSQVATEIPAAENRLVNINTATLEEFVALPGIGPALAKRIIAYREAHGPFQSIEDLTKVQGIGPQNMVYAHLITV